MFLFGHRKQSVGELGEKLAIKYLKKKGYKIVESNFQNNSGRRLGQIDIVAKIKDDKDLWEVVFVEVKSRVCQNDKEAIPEENINRRKLFKLQKIAQFYIRKNDLWDYSYRFDAISVLLSEDFKNAKIRHLKNIFL